MILPVMHTQIDDLLATLNTAMPVGLRLVVRAEHESCEDTIHDTMADAIKQQRIEAEWAREHARDQIIEARLRRTFGGAA